MFALVAAGVACEDNGPIAPTPVGEPGITPQSISISGSASMQRPGDTAQLNAIVTFSDGSTRDVSSQAGWNVDADIVGIARGGLVTARGYGQCQITVIYGTLSTRVPVRVVPPGMFLLTGRVTDDTSLPLWQARVSITSSMGQMSASTNFRGIYMLPAEGMVDVRVEMDNFEPQVKRVMVSQDEGLDFRLTFRPGGGFGGVYRLFFVASPACALPADATRRMYLARVSEPTPGTVTVMLSGSEFAVWGEAGFVGTRDGSTIQFDITSDYSADYQFIEMLDGTRELALLGKAVGMIGDTFSTAFNGNVVVRYRSGGILARCEAADHRFEFTR